LGSLVEESIFHYLDSGYEEILLMGIYDAFVEVLHPRMEELIFRPSSSCP